MTKPAIRRFADAEPTALADLVTRRPQITQMIGSEASREKCATGQMKGSIRRLLEAPQKKLAEIDREIDDAVRESPIWLQ